MLCPVLDLGIVLIPALALRATPFAIRLEFDYGVLYHFKAARAGGKGAMHGFLAKFGVAFTPEAVKILTAAFDDAWFELQASGASYSKSEYAEAARTHLAKFIIGAAQRGEWDRKKLRDDALFYLSQQKLSRVPPKTVLP